MLNNKDFDPRDIVYSPNDSATIGAEYLAQKRIDREQGIGLPLYIPSLDNRFIPAMPTELITVLGRPGSGKTSFMARWARARARHLKRLQLLNRVVVYLSFEQTIEEMNAFNIAADIQMSITNMARGEITDSEWEAILKSSGRRVDLPLWYIGHSIARRKKRPSITVDTLGRSLDVIEKWGDDGLVIDSVYVDYLQRFPINGKTDYRAESKTVALGDVTNRLKDGAIAFACPFIVGVQATRAVDDRKEPIPEAQDGQWTSDIEQVSDKMISVVRPRKYRRENETFAGYTVRGRNQMLITCLKQKMGDANFAEMIGFDPVYNRLDQLENEAYNPKLDVDNPDNWQN